MATTVQHQVELFTGIRPTGDLTLANYVGAVKPFLAIQDSGIRSLVFVADLHSLTDNEPSVARAYVREVVADYLALGLDPKKTDIFVQSAIAYQVSYLTILLSRLTTVAELLRVPTLKDKLKQNANPETANALLLLYPVMMAADILLQRAKSVPVGEDQVAHLEATRQLARNFNAKYGEVFPIPKVEQVRSLRILSLKGEGKMSKSKPEGAIFLTDAPAKARKKIMTAETATEGNMSPSLTSHVTLTKELTSDVAIHATIDAIIRDHMAGKQVMGAFKTILADVVEEFLTAFQKRRAEIVATPGTIDDILKKGAAIATANAEHTLDLVRAGMK